MGIFYSIAIQYLCTVITTSLKKPFKTRKHISKFVFITYSALIGMSVTAQLTLVSMMLTLTLTMSIIKLFTSGVNHQFIFLDQSHSSGLLCLLLMYQRLVLLLNYHVFVLMSIMSCCLD